MLLFIVIILVSYANGDSDEERLIDLLPDEEKQEFLEKVARRLIDGVKTKDSRFRSSGEISDEELDQHSEFVKRVLSEESKNLRRNLKNSNYDEMNGKDTEAQILEGDDREHIDLTLRDRGRKKRNQGNDNSDEGVETGLEKVSAEEKSEVNINTEKNEFNNKAISGENSTTEDIQVRGRISKKINDSPNLRRNIIRYYTEMDNYEPDKVIEQTQKENEEDDSSSNDKVKTHKHRVTAPIPLESEEDEIEPNNSDDGMDIVIEDKTVSNIKPEVITDVITTPPAVEPTTKGITSKDIEDVTVKKLRYLIEPIENTEIGINTQILRETNNFSEQDDDKVAVIKPKYNEAVKLDIVNKTSNNYGELFVSSLAAIEMSTRKIIEPKSNDLAIYIINTNEDNKKLDGNENKRKRRNSKDDKTQVNENEEDLGATKTSNEDSTESDNEQKYSTINSGLVDNSQEKYIDKLTENATKVSDGNYSVNVKDDREKDNKALHTENNPTDEVSDVLNKSTEVNVSLSDENNKDTVQISTLDYEQDVNTENILEGGIKNTDQYTESNDTNVQGNLNTVSDTGSNEDKAANIEHSENIKSDFSTEKNENAETTTEVYTEKDVSKNPENSDLKNEPNPAENNESQITTTDVNNEKYESDISKIKYENDLNSNNNNTIIDTTTVTVESVTENNNVSNSTDKNNNKNVKNNTEFKSNKSTDKKDDSTNGDKNSDSKNSLRSNTKIEYLLTTTERNFTSQTNEDPHLSKSTINSKNVPLKLNIRSGNEDDPTIVKLKKDNVENDTNSKFTEANFQNERSHWKKTNMEEIVSILKTNKHYVVYEVPEGETPFVKEGPNETATEDFNSEDQPQYVPIYNYSPNNAYYNPYNCLGPNEDETQEDEHVDIARESSDTKSFIESSSAEINTAKLLVPRTFKFPEKKNGKPVYKSFHKKSFNFRLPSLVDSKPKYTNIYFNPEDYKDLDYYFGRSNANKLISRAQKSQKDKYRLVSSSRDSEVENNPLYMMLDGRAKNHISAVRQVLYKHSHFGFRPYTTTPSPVSALIEDHGEDDTSVEDKDKDQLANNHGEANNGAEIVPIPDSNEMDVIRNSRAQNKAGIVLFLPNLRQSDINPILKHISMDYYFGFDSDKHNSKTKQDWRKKVKKSRDDIQNEILTVDRIKKIDKHEIKRKAVKCDPKKKELDKITKKDAKIENMGIIKEILLIGDPSDVFLHLEKLNKLNASYLRTNVQEQMVDVHVNVLKDMIEMDNDALDQFDWLGTAVDVLSSLKKLKYLTNNKIKGEAIHPSDNNILKYVLNLYKKAKTVTEESSETQKENINKLPRNKKRRREYLKKKGFIDRIWLYFQNRIDGDRLALEDLKTFDLFLNDMEDSLFKLYYALKHIAMVSSYKKQNWYKQLKQIYLNNSERKNLIAILIHISTTRILGLLHENKKVLEEDYDKYVNNNSENVRRSIEEFTFVLKLLKEVEEVERVSEVNKK